MQSIFVTEKEIGRWKKEITVLYRMAANACDFSPDEKEIGVLLRFIRDMLDVVCRLQEIKPFALTDTSMTSAIDEWGSLEKQVVEELFG